MEPPAFAARLRRWVPRLGVGLGAWRPVATTPSGPRHTGPSNDLIGIKAAEPRSALAAAGLAAAAVGLLGTGAGLIWIVAGVWALRSVGGGPLGGAWAVAVLGAGLRWGTMSLADVEVATRLAGPTLLSGPIVVRVALAVALVATLVDEARIGGLHARTWGDRAAAAAAASVLVPLFIVGGPARPLGPASLSWGFGAVVVTAAIVLAHRPLIRVGERIPVWAPIAVAAAATTTGVVFS